MKHIAIVLAAMILESCASDSNRNLDSRELDELSPAVQVLSFADYDDLFEVARDVVKIYRFTTSNKKAGHIESKLFGWKGEGVPQYGMVEIRIDKRRAAEGFFRIGVWAYRVEKLYQDGEPFSETDTGTWNISGVYEELQEEIARTIKTRCLERMAERGRSPRS